MATRSCIPRVRPGRYSVRNGCCVASDERRMASPCKSRTVPCPWPALVALLALSLRARDGFSTQRDPRSSERHRIRVGFLSRWILQQPSSQMVRQPPGVSSGRSHPQNWDADVVPFSRLSDREPRGLGTMRSASVQPGSADRGTTPRHASSPRVPPRSRRLTTMGPGRRRRPGSGAGPAPTSPPTRSRVEATTSADGDGLLSSVTLPNGRMNRMAGVATSRMPCRRPGGSGRERDLRVSRGRQAPFRGFSRTGATRRPAYCRSSGVVV